MTGLTDRVRFLQTADNVRLAWTASGQGPPLVKAANWLTHLEYDRKSIVWSHWQAFLEQHFTYIRYDERGIGMSQRQVENLSPSLWAPDLERVIETAMPDKPFVLLGISQGCGAALSYAAKYPEHVSQLVIYGGYLKGWARRTAEERRRREAVRELVELGWGQANPVFRRLYTSMFMPDGTEEQLAWFDEMCAKSTTPELAARIMGEQGNADFSEVPEKVNVPTLVMHCVDDSVVPCSEGIEIASRISSAEYVQLDSRNHILLDDEPAWETFKSVFLDFTERTSAGEEAVFASLSDRERDVLEKIAEGHSNAEISERLFISEKTVKNHITNIFEKLGVTNRSQAIVKARDGHFSGSNAER
jgi:DNA-binding CsgD family transcriptional regulator/pimeloyl-ACP methyl ester carboxylesterase